MNSHSLFRMARRGVTFGFLALIGLVSIATAQIPADPGEANKVLTVTLVRDSNPTDIVSGTITPDCG